MTFFMPNLDLHECFHPKKGKSNLKIIHLNVERGKQHIKKAHINL